MSRRMFSEGWHHAGSSEEMCEKVMADEITSTHEFAAVLSLVVNNPGRERQFSVDLFRSLVSIDSEHLLQIVTVHLSMR
jgi:hypothetical protein